MSDERAGQPAKAVLVPLSVPLDSVARTGAACSCTARPACPIIGGVRMDPVEPEGALARLTEMLGCPATHVINHLAADPTVLARKDPVFRSVLNRADLNVADGMGVVWACRYLGYPDVRQRTYGPDFMDRVCDWGRERGLRHYFYGAAPGVPERLAAALTKRYPGLEVSGLESPPFRELTDEELDEAAARIDATGADVLWLGVGTPRQQVLADRLRSRTHVRAILTVGAAFDFLAGVKAQAPGWVQRNGLEWAFRLASEPRRLWRRYVLGNPVFVTGVMIDSRRRKRGESAHLGRVE
jgi:N-acetylglucosaminyldiphosphoundecaprenol N-acetyl-beta-D-mannosaminyltransferase